MKAHKVTVFSVLLFMIILVISCASSSQQLTSASAKYAPDVPAKITTPDIVETRIGTLRFKDGNPDDVTVKMAYDQLDFGRGVDAFLRGMSATSVHALCRGFEEAGIRLNQDIGITEDLLDARSLFLTPNTTTVYTFFCVDLKDGPMVVRVPPRVLGPVDDADFRWVTDVGLTGPDKGAGGDYLFVPPGYKGTLPENGYHVSKPRTNRLLIFYRAFVEKGDIAAAVAGVKAKAAIFPLSRAANLPATSFVNASGLRFNTISANDFSFYQELDAVVQNEPADWVDPDTVGLYASIGIRKGQPFAPDARMKKILTDAVAVGNAIARSNIYASRDPQVPIYTDRQWFTLFVGGSYQFLNGAELGIYGNSKQEAMYPIYRTDADGGAFDAAMNRYTLYFPKDQLPPVNAFWSLTMYKLPSSLLVANPLNRYLINFSLLPDLKRNSDGGLTIYLQHESPGAAKESNWLPAPNGQFWAVLRLYGPKQETLDGRWKSPPMKRVE